MIGHETNPQPRECNYQDALHARTQELSHRELTQDDFEESVHCITSRGFEDSLKSLGGKVMKAIESGKPHDAQIVVAYIQGMMQHERFMDSSDKAIKEIIK